MAVAEKPQTGLDECLRFLLSCFRKRTSETKAKAITIKIGIKSIEGIGTESMEWMEIDVT